MKKLLILFFTFCFFLSFSQVKEGAKIVDLSLSFTASDAGESIFIQPLIGFATAENQVFYVGLSHNSQKQEFDFGDERKTSFTSFIVGYEKFVELGERVYFGSSFAGTYGIGKTEFLDDETDYNNIALIFRPRLHYFINSKWSVVTSVGNVQYSRQTAEDSFGENTSDVFSVNLNTSNILFGIRLNLNND